MEYFYTPPVSVTPPTLTITGEEFAHMTHVMRMHEGDALRAVDGAGNSYGAVITTITRDAATCRITEHLKRLHEPALALTLAAGLLKNPSRFDYLVEKSVEIGVTRIIPLLTERTIPHHGKTDRWRKLCIAAMKQSGRCVLPEIGPPVPFASFIDSCKEEALKLIPHERAEVPLTRAGAGAFERAVVCIGPEGGFSEAEIASAGKGGFQAVSLGTRRLRTETAALVACALILRENARGGG